MKSEMSIYLSPAGGLRLPSSAVAQGYGGQVQIWGHFTRLLDKSQEKIESRKGAKRRILDPRTKPFGAGLRRIYRINRMGLAIVNCIVD